MINIEFRFSSNGRELSLAEIADVFAERFASRIGREIRQQAGILLHDKQPAPTQEPKAVDLREAA